MNVKDIKTIGMYGAGTIGGGFAAYFALKGLNVNVYVRSEASKERAIPHIQGPIDSYVKLGLLDDGQKIWEKIKITTDPAEAFTGVYFVQENGAENLEQKHEMVAVMASSPPPPPAPLGPRSPPRLSTPSGSSWATPSTPPICCR